MDTNICDNLPKELVIMMDTFFTDGKYVNDFKITGNNKGFSVTIHLCNQPCSTPEWSPGITYKSPAALKRDKERQRNYIDSRSMLNSTEIPVGSAAKLVVTNNNTSVSMINRSTSCDISTITEEQFVNNDKNFGSTNDQNTGSSNLVLCTDYSTPIIDNMHEKSASVEDCEDNLSLNSDNSEKDFICKVKDSARNKSYKKVVHDTRNGQSKLYGLTDDIVVCHDITNRTYNTWAVHDRQHDALCEEIIQLIQRWPSANSKHCKDGIDTISMILPDIVKQMRCEGKNCD